MATEFYQTVMGRVFYETTMPTIKRELAKLNENMETANELKAKELHLKERELLLMERMLEMKMQETNTMKVNSNNERWSG